jgi:glycerol transport system ATP-binding protein
MGIRLENISKSTTSHPTFDDLSLAIEDGSFVALIAPTGSGKTSLLRLMAGIDKPDSGKIMVDGQDVTDVHVRDRNVAMVYQQFINYPSFTVYNNIASPLRVSKIKHSKAEIDRRVRSVAEQLQIGDLLRRLPEELSGGQQQRVAIARALAKDARLILMNEPLGNLDYKLREDLRLELKNLAAERDAIFVYATPEPIDALTMASHVAVLHNGRILQYGRMWDVYSQPQHIKVGAYFSDPPMNFLPCVVANGEAVVSSDLRIPVQAMGNNLVQGDYVLGIRPHHLHIGRNGTDQTITFSARVDLTEIVGSDTTLHLSHQHLNLIAHAPEYLSFHLDEQTIVSLDPTRIYIFDAKTSELVRSAAKTR